MKTAVIACFFCFLLLQGLPSLLTAGGIEEAFILNNASCTVDNAMFLEWINNAYPDKFKYLDERIKNGEVELVAGNGLDYDLCGPESMARHLTFGLNYFKEKYGRIPDYGWIAEGSSLNQKLPFFYKSAGIKSLLLKNALSGNFEKVFNIELSAGSSMPCYVSCGKPAENDMPTATVTVSSLLSAKNPALDVRIRVKNRIAENFLKDAEKFLFYSSKGPVGIAGYSYPEQKARYEMLNDAWRKLLLNQSASSISNASSKAGFRELLAKYDEVIAAGEKAINYSIETLADYINTGLEEIFKEGCPVCPVRSLKNILPGEIYVGKGYSIIVFNPLCWENTGIVELDAGEKPGLKSKYIIDQSGELILSQVTGNKIIFSAENAPSLGYVLYGVIPAIKELEATGGVKAVDNYTLENDFFRLKIDPQTGNIAGLYDKSLKNELFQPDIPGNVIESYVGTESAARINKPSGITVTEKGPVRCTVRITYRHDGSVYENDIMLYNKIPRIDFKLRITSNRNTSGNNLRVSFPLNISGDTATSDAVYSTVKYSLREDFAADSWADFTCDDGKYGVTLINDSSCKFSAGINRASIILLRKNDYPQILNGKNIYEFKYCIKPHKTYDGIQNTVKTGYEFNSRFYGHVESWHPGRFSKKQSFISMQSPDGVILDTIKKAGDNEEMLIKLFEVNGTDSMTIVNFESHPTLFWDTLFTEEADRKTPHDVGYKMKQIFFPIKAHETKFLRVFFMNP